MEDIQRLTAKDYEEAIDLMNMVFSMSSHPTDFPRLLPKLYHPTDESMNCNFAIRSNGRIRAIVGLFPMTAHAGGRILKVGGIGGVSTHPSERKSGMMKRLMDACIDEMKAEGYHLSCLGGMRQRYGYYGYEKAGATYKLLISHWDASKGRISCGSSANAVSGLHFEYLDSAAKERISGAREIFESQPFYCSRPPEEFYNHLISWYRQPWAALDGDGRLAGYLVANKEGNMISEIQAVSTEVLLNILSMWITEHAKEDVVLTLPAWGIDNIRILGSLSEGLNIEEAYNWKVFDWKEVLSALFAVKSRYTPLADGEAVMDINEYGKLSISVKDGAASIEKLDAASRAGCDLACDGRLAARLMFGPVQPTNVIPVAGRTSALFSSWFPLPLSWLPQDEI